MHPYFNISNNSILNWEYTAFCSAMKWKWITVSWNWTTTLCSYTTTKVGSIIDLDFWNNSQFNNLIDKRKPWNEKMCIWCELEGHCAGMCQTTREVLEWKEDWIEKFCELFKKTTRLLLEYDLVKEK
jgi:radical SAM protein with 4Fe4S-binding SPASM domain